MEDSDGVASVASVTDSEEEEQKAKERIWISVSTHPTTHQFWRDFYSRIGDLKIFWSDGDDTLMYHSVGRSHFQPHVRVDDFKFYNVVDACSSAHAEWSLANQCFTQIKEHKSPQWVWIPGAWEFSPKFEVDRWLEEWPVQCQTHTKTHMRWYSPHSTTQLKWF